MTGVAVGCEVVGDEAHLGAPRSRRWALMCTALALAQGRLATGALCRQILSLWINVLLFRRIASCILQESFRRLPHNDDSNTVYRMPPKAINELLLLALLAPLLFTDTRVAYTNRVGASDASPFGEAGTVAAICPDLHAHFWRHRERRGAHTHLYGRVAEEVLAGGTDKRISDLEEYLASTFPDPERSLVETFDFVEVCCGIKAPLSSEMAARGFRVGPSSTWPVTPRTTCSTAGFSSGCCS